MPELIEDYKFNKTDTIEEAQKILLGKLIKKGFKCPVCMQLAKVYKRKLIHIPARAMIALYRECGSDYGHISTLKSLQSVWNQGGYLTLGHHWGLLEELEEKRLDGGRAGYWRLTQNGIDFILSKIEVPQYAIIYDGECIDLEGQNVSIKTCLGKHFNYDELMNEKL